MHNIKDVCSEVIMSFLEAYGNLCDDLNLDKSKQLYTEVATRLISPLPEDASKKPYKLTDKMIQKIQVAIQKSAFKSSQDAASLALNRMILLCKRQGLIDGKVTISKRLRPDELAIQDEAAFALLDDFIEVRNWLCKRIQVVPRKRSDLPQLVIASLIAVNGISPANAHLRISSCQRNHLKISGSYPTLDVPKSRYHSTNPPVIRYPVLPEIKELLEIMNGDDRWLFPSGFNPDSWGQNRQRTKRLNRWLVQLWKNVFGPDNCVPRQWTMRTFTICSRLYFALEGSPIVTAFLSGRATFASIDVSGGNEVLDASGPAEPQLAKRDGTQQVEDTDMLLARDLIEAIRGHLGGYHHKLQSPKTKKAAALKLLGIAAVYYDLLDDFPCLRHMIDWIVWELEQDGGKRKMGTMRGLWGLIPTALLDELVTANPLELDSNQWLKLAEYLIQENTYAAGTRSKLKQHLKSFHSYLCNQYGLSPIDWRRGELKVYTDQPGGTFPLLSEFDHLFDKAGQEPDLLLRAQLQASLTLAFFGGLRAEEICLLSRMDIDEANIQIRIWWSKTRQGRRRLPLFLLTPGKYLAPFYYLQKQCATNESLLFQMPDGSQVSPDTLGKRIKKLIRDVLPTERDISIHTLRHGFASWLLIRYFALHEPDLLKASHNNGDPVIPNADHVVFSAQEQKKLVRVFNGRVAGEDFALDPASYLPKPEHFAYISRLIGHATRETTSRTYVHSMEWIAAYYVDKLRFTREETR